jgi:hypothetical protein
VLGATAPEYQSATTDVCCCDGERPHTSGNGVVQGGDVEAGVRGGSGGVKGMAARPLDRAGIDSVGEVHGSVEREA